MDGWRIALLAGAGWIAIMGLVRLMLARRNRVLQELEQQVAAERRKKRAAQEEAA
jgi:heme exporter protein D